MNFQAARRIDFQCKIKKLVPVTGRERGSNKDPVFKTCKTCPIIMKLSKGIPYLKKYPKMYKLRDTPLGFC